MKGEKSFFLKPGEDLEDGIQDMYVLGDDEGLVLRALEVIALTITYSGDLKSDHLKSGNI